MNQTNKEAAVEFAKGAAFTLLVTGVFVSFVVALGEPESNPEDKYKVVDHYGTCAVVRYRPEGKAEDVFFLDCGNTHLSERG